MKSKTKKSNSIGLGAFFIFSVVVIILISLSFKIFQIVKGSRFNSSDNYYILLSDRKQQELIYLSPANKSLGFLRLEGQSNSFSSVGLPFDISTSVSDTSLYETKSSVPSVLLSAHINPIDYIKIRIFLNQLSTDSVNTSVINSSDLNAIKALPQEISDPIISQENMTIEVVNATGQTGVGSYFAKQITNLGGNVILVSTQVDTSGVSEIDSDQKESSTVKKLSDMFGVKIVDKKAKISDIRVIIGKDLLGRIK